MCLSPVFRKPFSGGLWRRSLSHYNSCKVKKTWIRRSIVISTDEAFSFTGHLHSAVSLTLEQMEKKTSPEKINVILEGGS